MAQEIKVRNGKYQITRKPTDEDGKYLVAGGGKPYIVTLREDWKGARCSCPAGIFGRGKACKHEIMVREARSTMVAIQAQLTNVEFKF